MEGNTGILIDPGSLAAMVSIFLVCAVGVRERVGDLGRQEIAAGQQQRRRQKQCKHSFHGSLLLI